MGGGVGGGGGRVVHSEFSVQLRPKMNKIKTNKKLLIITDYQYLQIDK